MAGCSLAVSIPLNEVLCSEELCNRQGLIQQFAPNWSMVAAVAEAEWVYALENSVGQMFEARKL